MRTAAKGFYLAFFALFGHVHAYSPRTDSPNPDPSAVCAVRPDHHFDFHYGDATTKKYQINPRAIVSDACASYSTLDTLNRNLSPSLKDITQNTDFFAYYRLNLYDQKCPVRAWDDETGTCGNIACKVDTLEDERDIPPIWRAEELSKLEGPKAAHPGRDLQRERGSQRPLQGTLGEDVGESCVVEYDDECDERDYCVPEDESATAKGDYVSLVDNPERFTGYAGKDVWDAIYRENCFSKEPSSSTLGSGVAKPFGPFQAANDLRNVMQAGSSNNELALDDTCLEKRVFYRIISGMHTSINTHICNDYLNQTTGTWGPNLACYTDRLASHPERISNLYFNYALLLRAVTKLRTYLKGYTFCTGDPSLDTLTKSKILSLTSLASTHRAGRIFDESVMFADPQNSLPLKEDFRNRFRNVSRLMDCVGCDKCRLWGKLQTVGYGTALKVLFEFDEEKNGENPPLRRTELVALVNTLDRVSTSINALGKMRDLVLAQHDHPPSKTQGHLPPATESQPSKGRNKEEQQSPPQTPRSSDPSENHSDLDDLDDFPSDFEAQNAEADEEESIMEVIRAEARTIYRAYIFILKSWLHLPRKILKIVVGEMVRLWSFWLGLPVAERSWEIRLPRREEL